MNALPEPQAGAVANFLLYKACILCTWAQTLVDMGRIETLLDEQQRLDPIVINAKTEGVLCPALVELICEALESSGREPGHS